MSYLINSLKSIEHFTIPDIISKQYGVGLDQLSSLFSGNTGSIPKEYAEIYTDRLTRLGVVELLKEISKNIHKICLMKILKSK
jgi:hypothetical protein